MELKIEEISCQSQFFPERNSLVLNQIACEIEFKAATDLV